MQIRATHIKSGRTGHVVDEVKGWRGISEFYFEQDHNSDGTASGWYRSFELEIPGVNR